MGEGLTFKREKTAQNAKWKCGYLLKMTSASSKHTTVEDSDDVDARQLAFSYVAEGLRDAVENERRGGVEVYENIICNLVEVGSAFKG